MQIGVAAAMQHPQIVLRARLRAHPAPASPAHLLMDALYRRILGGLGLRKRAREDHAEAQGVGCS